MIQRHKSSPLFPYTTLFRSGLHGDSPSRVWVAGSIASSASKQWRDRKSTRLNSSHVSTSYAVFCLKKKNSTSGGYFDNYVSGGRNYFAKSVAYPGVTPRR